MSAYGIFCAASARSKIATFPLRAPCARSLHSEQTPAFVKWAKPACCHSVSLINNAKRSRLTWACGFVPGASGFPAAKKGLPREALSIISPVRALSDFPMENRLPPPFPKSLDDFGNNASADGAA
ncbi:hypothetical protein, partial [Leisingera sp. ANG-S5]|uniref:hypothetical protein n=1 Tax=Leisingera sp. ANG-S5 TaxID=1577901 RepID=UPI0019D36587